MPFKRLATIGILCCPFVGMAQDRHPAMESPWAVNMGSYFANRDLKATASGSVGGLTRQVDFEQSTGLDDNDSMFMGEVSWQFSEKWGVAAQYFRTGRSASFTLDETVEWQGDTFEVGGKVSAGSDMKVTRVFFARRFRDAGPHSLRLGAGIHWLDLEAQISGQATLEDKSKEFRRSVASASLPVPNIGAWYRYSPNDRWLVNARLDWLSASIGDYKGNIWNGSVGINYRIWERIGVGASYQYFNLAGTLKEDNWRGDIETTFTGPYFYVSGFW